MILFPLDDDEMRDILSQAATAIENAARFARSLADGFVRFPDDQDARVQLVNSSLTIKLGVACQIDAIQFALVGCDIATCVPDRQGLN